MSETYHNIPYLGFYFGAPMKQKAKHDFYVQLAREELAQEEKRRQEKIQREMEKAQTFVDKVVRTIYRRDILCPWSVNPHLISTVGPDFRAAVQYLLKQHGLVYRDRHRTYDMEVVFSLRKSAKVSALYKEVLEAIKVEKAAYDMGPVHEEADLIMRQFYRKVAKGTCLVMRVSVWHCQTLSDMFKHFLLDQLQSRTHWNVNMHDGSWVVGTYEHVVFTRRLW